MSSISSVAEALGRMSAGYKTSTAVNAALSQKEFVPLIGPFAVGKTSLMRAAETLDGAFGRVRSFTTRARRDGEKENAYDFRAHDVSTLQQIYDEAVARVLVQFTVHPTTGNIYGSTLGSYWAEYPMLDAMPSSLPGLVHLPFRAIRIVSITVPPDEWMSRMAIRLQGGDPADVQKRLQEGISNITWSLDQGREHCWVINGGRIVEDAANDLIRFARDGVSTSTREAREVATQLLRRMQEMHAL